MSKFDKFLKGLMIFVGHLTFWTIVLAALAVSGNAFYEVLTGTVGFEKWVAILGAVVVDAAAIWLGHHTTVLAKLEDDTTNAKYATWFIILLSLSVNFYHG